MENTTLTLTFNTKRLSALAYHMGKKEADLKEELNDHLQRMYERYVPQTAREYLDDKIAREGAAKPARPRRQAEESHVRSQTDQEMGQAGSARGIRISMKMKLPEGCISGLRMAV